MIRAIIAVVTTIIIYITYVYLLGKPYYTEAHQYLDNLHHKVDSLLGIHEDEHKEQADQSKILYGIDASWGQKD